MKIPETSANVGAYYGNEENGQWQPNGVIIDSGVGGGIVGSGDAGHRPVYPVHVPRGHIPGPYVMAGAYYPPGPYPTAPQDDFEDYMWMENEEEFDKQVMQQLEEEALMEQCIEAMLEDEQREQRHRPVSNGHNRYPTTSNGQGSLSLEEAVSRSTLNPLAAEFVPNRARQVTEVPQEKTTTESKTEVESSKETSEQTDKVDSKEDVKAEESSQPTEPPEVSAADIQPIEDNKQKEVKKDTKKTEVKKSAKTEVKKAKPISVKEVKTQKKKEEKVKKEEVIKKEEVVKKEEIKEEPSEIVKQTSPAPEETSQPGIKPINYAAAAKAMKPKKAMSPTNLLEPSIDKPKPEKVEKKVVKDKSKVDKPNVQRKNSAK